MHGFIKQLSAKIHKTKLNVAQHLHGTSKVRGVLQNLKPTTEAFAFKDLESSGQWIKCDSFGRVRTPVARKTHDGAWKLSVARKATREDAEAC